MIARDRQADFLASSWRRCTDTYKLKASLHKGAEIVTARELKVASEALELLRTIADGEIKHFLRRVAGANYVAILADAKGIALDVDSTMPIDNEMRRLGVCAGAVWSEPLAGTSGIGTSLVERRAIAVRGQEHFFHAYACLTCMAAPIRDWTGATLAVFDVSSIASLSQDTQSLILDLVEAAARRIERRYFFARNGRRSILRILLRQDDVDDGGSMLFALDDDGRVIEFFGDEQSPHRSKFVGHLLSDIMEISWDGTGIKDQKGETLERIGIAQLRGFDRPCFASLRMRKTATAVGKRGNPASFQSSTLDGARLDLGTLAGGDPLLRSHVNKIMRLAGRRLPILLQGETGTGKEEFARAIHNAGPRSSGAFIAIDCSSIPESLVESELFGYEAGTFTGGRKEGRRGRIADANQGTLFLDEIGDMPLTLQTRLLRVLAQREVLPLGGAKPVNVDFHLISASHQDLLTLVGVGRFRQDLFFRIAGVRLELPPLRSRQDKERIISQALAIEAAEMELPSVPALSIPALKVLMAHAWPGNIRELRLAMRYALAHTISDEIQPDDLPSWLCSTTLYEHGDDLAVGEENCSSPSELVEVLTHHNWCVSDAAVALKVNRRTLYRWMRRHAIVRPN